MKYDYDLFIIGGGSGGIRMARWSAQLGAKVALCEKDRMGGTCVIRGCIPKKLMVYASSFKKNFKRAQDYGWQFDPDSVSLDWEHFRSIKDREISRLEAIYNKILKNNQVDFFADHGSLKGPHTVKVGHKSYTAKFIVIAVGGWPSLLDIPGKEHCISSNEIFNIKKIPKSLLVIGSGYIGLEFASLFKILGSDVSLMFRKELILSGFDQDIRKKLQEELSKQGLKLLAKTQPTGITKKRELLEVSYTQEKKLVEGKKSEGEKISAREKTWLGEQVLMATGRKANLEGLNLESVGIKPGKGQIPVNQNFQTSCPSIYAIGDCTDQPYQLTPVALNEAIFLSEHLFNKSQKIADYENVPSAVFTQPEVATVGLSEEQALEKGFEISIYESRFRALKLTLTQSQEKTYMKWVVCKKTDQLLGCHIVGENAGEILQGFAVAVKNKLKKSQIDQTIGIHPSSAEELVTMRSPR